MEYIQLFPSSFITIVLLFFGMGVLYLYMGYRLKKANPLRQGSTFEVLTEAYFEFFENLVRTNLGDDDKTVELLAPIIMMLFTSIFVGNAVALIGFREAAFNSAFAIVWGFLMFLLWNGYAIYKIGIGGFLKSFVHPNVFFLPIEIVGFFSKVISITVRLIGNIASGVIFISMIWLALGMITDSNTLLGIGAGIVLSPLVAALSFYFSLFSPLIQALVFSMLTLGNISVFLEEE